MTIWQYTDATGIERRGKFVTFFDHGGTDVTYQFHRLDDVGIPITYPNGGKAIDMVSGQHLKAAKRIWSE